MHLEMGSEMAWLKYEIVDQFLSSKTITCKLQLNMGVLVTYWCQQVRIHACDQLDCAIIEPKILNV